MHRHAYSADLVLGARKCVSLKRRVTIAALTCALMPPGVHADQQPEQAAGVDPLVRTVEESRLAEVRGGSATSAVAVEQIGVILWDELRGRPSPPVRNAMDASGVRAELNIVRR